ncbi:MAG: family 10 glycosylhydrolase [Micromonosporaceae bacterium]|nr:family 10 glycosylhydrolase [Micromonosporaceae bacterium]
MVEPTRRQLLGTLGAGTLAAASGLVIPQSAYAGASVAGAAPGVADCDPNPATPKRQMRAMWIASVVNIDWPSRRGLPVEQQKAEYLRLLDEAQAYRLNAVFVQVRPTADAFWPSPLEPWSMWLTGEQGKDPGYDPLEFLVRESHKRNLEFHAWFNPYRVSMPASLGHAGVDVNKLPADHVARRNPDWVVPYPVDNAGGRLYFDPGIPEVRDFVQNAIMHAVENYDIDAVHFDDYFYPYPAAGQDFGDHHTYAEHGAGFDNIHDWRRNNTNLLIKQIGERIHAAKPWVKFGISPFGIWRNKGTDPRGSETNGLQSYDAIYADSRLWVKAGWLDYINPQIYWNIGFTVADYAKLTPWWADVVAGTGVHLYAGQAAYKIGTGGAWDDPAELSKHLTFNRDYPDVHGDVHFSAVQLRANRLGAISRLVSEQYSRPALIPVIAARGGSAPAAPVITTVGRADGEVELDIQPTAGSAPAAYAVYRFEGRSVPDCGYDDAAHLIGTVRADGAGASFEDKTVSHGKAYTYAATALDRLHHESQPSPPRTV